MKNNMDINYIYSAAMSCLLSGMDFSGRPTGPSKPMPLILDEEGRVVDTSGRTVQPVIRQPTIKVHHMHTRTHIHVHA